MILLYCGTVIVLTYFIQSTKIFDYIFIGRLLKELRNCKICLGWWISLVLYPVFKITMFDGVINISENWLDNLLINSFVLIINSVILSLLTYYLVEGWQKHHTIHYIK